MYKILTLSLLLLVAGCPSVDELTLTTQEAEELVDRVETAIQAQQELTKFAHSVARGDADIAAYTYDPPTEANGWVGTVTADSATFPFGIGDFSMTFTAIGDGGPVDPYVTNITDDQQVDVTVSAGFVGMNDGLPIDIVANFTGVTQQNATDLLVTRINGEFDVDYDSYVAAIDAVDLDVTIDTLTNEVTSIVGDMDATVDIPDFKLDADFDIEGMGDTLNIGIEVADTTLDYLLSLSDLF